MIQAQKEVADLKLSLLVGQVKQMPGANRLVEPVAPQRGVVPAVL